jgi:hypothetical protein
MWAMNELEMPDDDSPRPNLANMPGMDEMLALYEKVLAELDSAISTQKDFASDDKSSSARHGKDLAN